MKVLITGGFGFIGSHLADKFYREGDDVFIIDHLESGNKGNIQQKHRFYELNTADPKCEEVFKSNQFDVILHMAAYPKVAYRETENYQDTQSAILGLVNMLSLAVKYKVRKFIYASSASVYGESLDFSCTEETPVNPSSICAVNKWLGEYYCAKWSELYPIETVSLRISNVYGPRQNPDQGGVVAVCLDRLIRGESFTVYGDGEQLRDFIYVEDVADAVYRAANIHFSGVLNVSTGRATSIHNLLSLTEKYGAFSALEYQKSQPGEIRNSVLSNTAIVRVYDWVPMTSLEEGLEKTYEHYVHSETKGTYQTVPKKTSAVKKQRLTERFSQKAKKRKWMPYLENVGAFLLLGLFSVSNEYTYNSLPIDLNLFLIILFTIIYGARQGIVSFVLSVISVVSVNILTGHDPIILLYSSGLYLTFAYYVLISFSIGYIKDTLVRDNADKQETIEILNQKIDFVASLYNDMRIVRDELQGQIVNSEDSLGKIISIIQEIDTLNPEEVFAKAVNVLEKLMRTQSVAIFHFNETGKYARMMACSAVLGNTISKSLRIEDSPEIIHSVVNKDLYVAKDLAEGRPLLAMPVLDRDSVVGSILIYHTEFERLTLSYQNYFRIITTLISSALYKAYTYDAAIDSEKYMSGTHILKPNVYHEMLTNKRLLQKKHSVSYVVLKILLEGVYAKAVAETVSGMIRETDFMGLEQESELHLLLGNTNRKEAEFVIQRLEKIGLHAEPMETGDADE